MILAPIVVKRSPDMDAAAEEVTGAEKALVGFRPVYVWESQTYGQPLAEISAVTGDPGDYADRLKSYVAQLGIALEYSSDIAPAKGMSHGGKIILLPKLSPAETFSTLVHEVAHEKLHRTERRAETNRCFANPQRTLSVRLARKPMDLPFGRGCRKCRLLTNLQGKGGPSLAPLTYATTERFSSTASIPSRTPYFQISLTNSPSPSSGRRARSSKIRDTRVARTLRVPAPEISR